MFVTAVVGNNTVIYEHLTLPGSGETHLRCGGNYYRSFAANFLPILTVKQL